MNDAPADAPEKRYKEGSWWLVTPRVYLYALLLARRCPRDHEHVELLAHQPRLLQRLFDRVLAARGFAARSLVLARAPALPLHPLLFI